MAVLLWCGGGSTGSRDFDKKPPSHISQKGFFLPQTDFHSLMGLSSVCLQIDGRENRSSCWLPWLCARQTGRGSFEGSAEKEEANSLGVWRLSLFSCLCLPSSLQRVTTLGSSTVKIELLKPELARALSDYCCSDWSWWLKCIHKDFNVFLCCSFEAKKRWETKSNMGYMWPTCREKWKKTLFYFAVNLIKVIFVCLFDSSTFPFYTFEDVAPAAREGRKVSSWLREREKTNPESKKMMQHSN